MTGNKEGTHQEKPARKDFDDRFPIVGIGASAGGVRALESFFSQFQPDCGMAFIVVQHLSTDHESHMKELLKKQTDMTVVDAEEGRSLSPDTIYLNPPGVEVVVRNRTLHTREISREDGSGVPIDVLFRSLAEDLAEYAICVVLSGANADGTQGAKAVKGEGGLVVAQDPEEASHGRMPSSVVEADMADLVPTTSTRSINGTRPPQKSCPRSRPRSRPDRKRRRDAPVGSGSGPPGRITTGPISGPSSSRPSPGNTPGRPC